MSATDATAPPASPAPHPAPHTPWGRVVGLGVAVAAVVGVLVLAFSWPAVTAEPKDLPVAVAGPPQAVAGLETTLDEAQPGAVDLVPVADRDAAVAAIQERDVYGAIVLGGAPEVLTASAASSVTNQLLTAAASQLQAGLEQQAAAAGGDPAAAPTVTVTDVVPLSADDPRGTGLTAALFPLVLGGIVGGVAVSLLVVGALRRVLAVAVYSAVGGVVLVAVLQSWFGALQGDWWTDAGAAALALAAVAAPITGFVALLGRAGIALGAVTMMLVANPISGATMPPEFLPWHWGEIGQWFPPGAGATLLKELSYFPDASTAFAWAVLAGWTAVGVLLTAIAVVRERRTPDSVDAPELVPVG